MKIRIDKVVVERGLAPSRERAQALILEGKVYVDNFPVTKAGAMVDSGANVVLKGEDIPYVSRGGLKLKAAIDHFGISCKDKIAMDVGSSTGGFTDCMLQEGAQKVYAVDVGYGQFDWKLRNDPRVVLMERTNIRHLERGAIEDTIEIVVIDVSFISLKLVVPKVVEFMAPGAELVALIKPQFEVGKGEVGKGGIVRDSEKRAAAVEDVRTSLEAIGLATVGVIESPITGQKGNIEYLIYMRGA